METFSLAVSRPIARILLLPMTMAKTTIATGTTEYFKSMHTVRTHTHNRDNNDGYNFRKTLLKCDDN